MASRLAVAGLAVHAVAVVAVLVLALDRIALLQGLEAGTAGLARAEFSDRWYAAAGLVDGLTFVVAGILFIVWFHRAYRGLRGVGAFGMRFSTGWAIGAWFVPFLNLVRPKQIADELWRGTEPGSSSTNVAGPTAPAVDRLVPAWWALFLVQSIGASVTARVASGDDTITALRTEALLTAAVALAGVIGLVLAVAFVRQVTGRYEARRRGAPVERPGVAGGLAAVLVAIALGGAVGGAAAAASMTSDDGAPPLPAPEAAAGPEPSVDAYDEELLDHLHRACFNTDRAIEALPEPEDLDQLATYYERLLDAARQRDEALRAAAVPAEVRPEYEAQFLLPVEEETARLRATFTPLIDAARAGDAARVEEVAASIPDTAGSVPSAAAYADAIGAGACAASFTPASS